MEILDLLFAGDLVLCVDSEEDLKIIRYLLVYDRNGLKVSGDNSKVGM